MNLKRDRDDFLDYFEFFGKCNSAILADYKENRNSESWRTSRVVEELCEYIIYLEGKVK